MIRLLLPVTLAVALLGSAHRAPAQSTPLEIRAQLADHFDRSSRKIVTLARAVPAELYTWQPGDGVMSVAQVYTHIARYNYLYLAESFGIDAPPGVDWPNFESIAEKTRVLELLERSVQHVRTSVAALDEDALTRSTLLYGRRVAGWAVLVQLVAHLNEHVGQSVAYARVNGIVPPWSR